MADEDAWALEVLQDLERFFDANDLIASKESTMQTIGVVRGEIARLKWHKILALLDNQNPN
jgi:hypothetical protein